MNVPHTTLGKLPSFKLEVDMVSNMASLHLVKSALAACQQCCIPARRVLGAVALQKLLEG
jgi:hypothetical protein